MNFGLALSLTIAISASIGTMIGLAAAAARAAYWRTRAQQLERRLNARRSNGREAPLFDRFHRGRRERDRAQEAVTPG